MNEEQWQIVPKNFTLWERRDFLMLMYVRKEKGKLGSYRLCIPKEIRKKSKYHKNNRKAYYNLLEKGTSLKIQWIPEDQAKRHSRIAHNGQMSIPASMVKPYVGEKKRIRVPHEIEDGNIIIDLKELKDAEELENLSSSSKAVSTCSSPNSNGQERVLRKEIAGTLKRSMKKEVAPTEGISKCHNCLEEIRLTKDGLGKDYRGATMVGKWIFWHLPRQCPKSSNTHAKLSVV